MRSNVLPFIRRRSTATAAAGLALALGLSAPGAAQTTFAWPDTTVDVTKYNRIEQCQAATDRVAAGEIARQDRIAWRDTMPYDAQETLRPAPASVTETAARCSARFPVATANLRDFAPLLRLYLAAGRDVDAKMLVERRTAAATTTRERVAVGDSAVDTYLAARPVRLDAAEQILVTRARGATDRLDRMELYARLVDAAVSANDTARARRASELVVAVADSLTQAERESDKYVTMEPSPTPGLPPRGGDGLVFNAVRQVLGLRTLLDSLRHSTQAMVSLERNLWAKIMKERPESFPFPIGEKAPALTADYWFPREASATPHPSPGHVAIVEFLDTWMPSIGCLGVDGWGIVSDVCYGMTLRRLSDRFPGLDVTFVLKTHGSFLYVPPPSAADEATLIRKWREGSKLPNMTIAVESTPFWKLPSPDGRRVEKPTPDAVAYGFGKSWTGTYYLVDQDGLIVDVLFNEAVAPLFIDALVQRQKEGGARVGK